MTLGLGSVGADDGTVGESCCGGGIQALRRQLQRVHVALSRGGEAGWAREALQGGRLDGGAGRLRSGAQVDVLAVAAELASSLSVKAADFGGVDADGGKGAVTQQVIQGSGAAEGDEWVERRGAVGVDLDSLGSVGQVRGGLEVAVKGTAGGSGSGLGAELVDEAGLDVNLVAAGASVATALLEEEAEAEVAGLAWAVLLSNTAGLSNVFHWDDNLSGSVARIDHLKADGARRKVGRGRHVSRV